MSGSQVGLVTSPGAFLFATEPQPDEIERATHADQEANQGEVGGVILGDYAGIEEGTSVRRTGEVLSVPVGDGFLGRVVDPLGRPIDGKGDITPDARRALELQR